MRLCLVTLIVWLAVMPQVVSVATNQQATLVQLVNLERTHPKLHGISGIEMQGNGASALVISDFGDLLLLGFGRDLSGKITSVHLVRSGKILPTLDGTWNKRDNDAEGLAISPAPDQRVYVSFEHDHRILVLSNPFGKLKAEIRPDFFRGFQPNSGLEALAIRHDGLLCAIPERSGALSRSFPIYCKKGERWGIAARLSRSDGFLVVGADFGPGGVLYVLERKFQLFSFASRVRKIDLHTGKETIIWQSQFGEYDNLEGISVWRSPSGWLKMTLISDDNNRSLQQTHLVEFVLGGPLP